MVEPAQMTPPEAPACAPEVHNLVRADTYVDSVALMRIASALTTLPGIAAAGLVMATPANRQQVEAAGLLAAEGAAARPNDLLIALRCPPDAVPRAVEEADRLLAQGRPDDAHGAGGAGAREDEDEPHRSLATVPGTPRLAVISTPGAYAAAEALKALRLGMHAFVFSDNVPVADEVALKREAHARGLLMMGPDCGTAVLDGIPLGFANAVRRGPVGLIGASGTGLQQVSTLLQAYGTGVSQIIGVGGRDLSEEVGGACMRDALDVLAADPATETIVLVSKPPAPGVARAVLAHAARTGKPVVAAFLGGAPDAPPGVSVAGSLRDAARIAAGLDGPAPVPAPLSPPAGERRLLRALYAGGTFAYEARLRLEAAGVKADTDARPPAPGEAPRLPGSHVVLDLGDDLFTAGRPHPMIDPAVRAPWLAAALRDPSTAVVVVDVVLGYGAGADPAGAVADVVAQERAVSGARLPHIVAFVVGTPDDPQGLDGQVRALRDVGVTVLDSSTTAADALAAAFAPVPCGTPSDRRNR
ncbi:transcriptional regulator [Streptomyces xanthii]|nr:transcriptional regulator [Streptomyces xanthii]